MIHAINKPIITGHAEYEDTMIKKVGRWLIFKTESWVTVSTQHIGNDITIETDRPIRNVYLNGKLLTCPPTQKQ